MVSHQGRQSAPGIPTIIWAYASRITAMMIGVVVFHTLVATPVLVAAGIGYPSLFPWVVLALVGWIALYTADTVFIILWNGPEWFGEQIDRLSKPQFILVGALVVVYVNVVLALAAVFAFVVASLGSPLLAVGVALVYPNLDFVLGARGVSPGLLVLIGILSVLHLFGVLRDVTAEALLEALRLGQPPARGRPGQSGNIGV